MTPKDPTKVRVNALFPELRGGKCRVEAEGEGASVRSAVSSAIRALMKSRKLKGQRFVRIEVSIDIFKPIKVKETDETETERAVTEPVS